MDRLVAFRTGGRLWLGGMMVLNALAAVAATLALGGPVATVGGLAVAFLIAGIMAVMGIAKSATSRVMTAIFAQAQVALIVGAMAGHPWQIDAHMHFFATMAVLILLVDYRPVIAGAAAVAVHHLALNVLLPDLVYSGGSDLPRTIMHAVILVLATGALLLGSRLLESTMRQVEQETAQREDMVEQLANSVGRVVSAGVQGDFSQRIAETFRDDRIGQIANGTNMLFETLDRELSEIGRIMGRLAAGDLGASMHGASSGAFGDLQASVNDTISSLRDIVNKLNDLGVSINRESGEILIGAEALSEQSMNQAASVEETTAAIQVITQTIKGNVEAAGAMAELASSTFRKGTDGRGIVEGANQAMSEMSSSAQRIAQIVDIMNEISFQTNLLALNASVEAARAGEAGRGFAIVAQEVRALAVRSAESASDIKSVIEQSVSNVESGVTFVNALADTMNVMTESASEVERMARNISENNMAQSANMAEISASMLEIDQTTQKTAERATDYTSRSQRLQALAAGLSTAIQVFRTKTSRPPARSSGLDRAA